MTTMNRIHSVTSHGPRRARGFTIIELMVGMLVGLLATVVMFQVFAVSEGQKRTTTGAGDAQQNGVGSVFVIERDARMAGFGLSYTPMFGCTVGAWNAGTAFTFPLAPYVIADGTAGTPDSLTIAYGDTRAFASPVKLGANMADPGAVIKVYNRFGLSLGDLFIVASTTDFVCTLYQVQDRPGTDGIDHKSGGFVDAAGVARVTTYNQTGGNPGAMAYPKWDLAKRRGGRIINLGQSPTVVRYSLVGNQLLATNVLVPGEKPIVVSDGVVQFQVQYGYDGNADGLMDPTATSTTVVTGGADQWADSLPATPTNAMWTNIVGVRFAVVTRSVTPEKPDPATGVCATTVAPPKWIAAGPAPDGRDIDVSADPDWKCYRYRVFEITVPARNLAWTPNESL
jgi:type IV pilus assembly protein PilW